MSQKSGDLFKRYENNPILTADNCPSNWHANSVFNAGVGDLRRKTHLFLRVEDREGLSFLVSAFSKDGITNWQFSDVIFQGSDNGNISNGVEDPRLIWMPTMKQWLIVYTNYSLYGPMVALSSSENFQNFSHFGNILTPDNKDAAILPEPINGYWWLIHRPSTPEDGKKHIWICKAPCRNKNDPEELCYWGKHQVLMEADGTNRWDGKQIGLSTPLLKTRKGWLLLYHGVKSTSAGPLYRLGLALLALDDPAKVTHRTKEFIMKAQNSEMLGDVGGAIFPCGWRIHSDGKIRLYYGIADSMLGYAEASLSDVLKCVLSYPI